MRFPGQPSALVCALAFGVCDGWSAGVAAFKEQTFHRDSTAKVVAYFRIIGLNRDYLRIVTGNGNLDILRSKVVAYLELTDGIPAAIMEEHDILPLRGALSVMRDFTTRYPASAPLLEMRCEALAAHIRRFDAGELRQDGVWLSVSELTRIRQSRAAERKALALAEAEKRVFEAARRDEGLVLHDGRWMPLHEADQLPPESVTELSACLEPMWNGSLEGAKFTVKNLANLASSQTGAPKVRTERLMLAVRNLFQGEEKLTQQMITRAGELREAAVHDKNAREWQIPNALGTLRESAAEESRKKANQTRKRLDRALEVSRQELINRLQEIDIVTADFHNLQERRVVLILGTVARIMAARHFAETEFRPSFPAETLASIRQRIIESKQTASAP